MRLSYRENAKRKRELGMKYREREAISEQIANLREEKKAIRLLYQEIMKQEIELLDRLREIEGTKIKEHSPVKSLKDVLEELKDKEGENTPIILSAENEPVNSVIESKAFKKEVKEAIAKENEKRLSKNSDNQVWKKGRRFSATRGGEIVLDYLKTCGRPVPLSDINELLRNAGYMEGNGVMRMNGIMKKYATVQKATRGHYQYVPPK